MSYREKILECLGRLPEKAELCPGIVKSEDKGTHILQLVGYNAEENDRITAWLLLPKKLKRKNAAVIVPHQHNGEFYLGKSEPAGLSKNAMYHYGLDLCLRGYVVLCPDDEGFEDRRPPEYKRKENECLEGAGYERFLFCKYILEGRTLQGKYLSDLARGVDYLETLDFVDRERIGVLGHSLGGQEALWLAWFDSRIKAGVSSCGFSQIRSILRDGVNHNLAMYTHGFLNAGDIGDLVCDLAPKPFMITNGTEDGLFPLDGVREIAETARKAYEEKGASENFKSVIFEGSHSFPASVKEEAYGWLDGFLKPGADMNA